LFVLVGPAAEESIAQLALYMDVPFVKIHSAHSPRPSRYEVSGVGILIPHRHRPASATGHISKRFFGMVLLVLNGIAEPDIFGTPLPSLFFSCHL